MVFKVGQSPVTRGHGKGIRLLREIAIYTGDDCVIWPYSRTRGYGTFGFDGKIHYAHRFMCELVNGPAPAGHEAAHSCGNGHRGCITPKHLSWKTPVENQADRKVHGTAKKPGSARYKLTAEQVAEIRALKGTKTHAEIAAVYGCTRENIGAILRGKNWSTGLYDPQGVHRRAQVAPNGS